MKKKIFLLIIFSLLLLLSCSSKKEASTRDLRVIDVAGSIGSGRVVNLSEIASEILFIPLETTDKSLVGTPMRSVFYEKDLIYLVDVKGSSEILQIFDKNGRFVKELNRQGRGPQEYERLCKLHIDRGSGNLSVTSYNKIVEYSKDGQFIRQVNFPGNDKISGNVDLFSISSKLNENLYLIPANIHKGTDYSVVAIDTSSNIKMLIKYPEVEKELVNDLPRLYAFFNPLLFNYKDTIRVINGCNEYILGVSKDLKIDTSYIINYGDYKIKNGYVNYRAGSRSPFIARYSQIFESDGYLFMQFHLGSLAHKPREVKSGSGEKISLPISCALFNKKNGKFTFADQPAYDQVGFADDLEGGPAFWPAYISDDEYMVSSMTADEFIRHSQTPGCSEKFRQIASKLKDTDNPVVVLVKLKFNN